MGAGGTSIGRRALLRWLAGVCLSMLGGSLVRGCGGDSGGSEQLRSAVIGLDFTPNAVHAPIYMAVRERL